MLNLRRLRIGPRVALGFGSAIAAFVAALVTIGWSGHQVEAEVASALSARAGQTASAAIVVLAQKNAIDSLQMLVSPSEQQQKSLAQALEQRDAAIGQSLQALQASLGDEEEQARVAKARQLHGTYRAGVKRISGMVLAGKQSEAAFAADEEMTPMMAPFFKALEDLQTHLQARAAAADARVSEVQARSAWVVWLAGVLGVTLAAAAAWLIVASLTVPLRRAVAMVERVGSGDLAYRASDRGRDEVSQLIASLNAMSQSLAAVIQDVRRGSDEVATASAQIAQGNQDLSSRTEQQAAALEQTAASMEQLGSAVRVTADHAAEADRMAKGASDTAVSGGRIVGEVVSTMQSIDDSSRRIADIISVIDGIAFQTNILALNAAVEAARAGEQGRGFAVVAGEVRTLAKRSADAAREIKQLIGTSVERVAAGTQHADRAGRAMQDIVSSIRRVSDIVGEITNASREQSAGVAQVGQAVSQMDHGTQQNASLVQQSAAAASQLRQQAEQLSASVARFRLAASA